VFFYIASSPKSLILSEDLAHFFRFLLQVHGFTGGPAAFLALFALCPGFCEVRPFCWTDLTIRLIVMGPVLNRAHSVQLFLDPILVVVTQIFIKFFQEVLD